MTLLAHAADWIEAAILGAPALAFGVWLVVTQVRERRRGGRPDQA